MHKRCLWRSEGSETTAAASGGLWPGFSENMRVLEEMVRRCPGEACGYETELAGEQ